MTAFVVGQKVLLNFGTVVEGPQDQDGWTEVEIPWERNGDGPMRLWCRSDDVLPLDDLREVLEGLRSLASPDNPGDWSQQHTRCFNRARALLAQLVEARGDAE